MQDKLQLMKENSVFCIALRRSNRGLIRSHHLWWQLGESDPNVHYHIAKSQRFHVDISDFTDDENDPATQVC